MQSISSDTAPGSRNDRSSHAETAVSRRCRACGRCDVPVRTRRRAMPIYPPCSSGRVATAGPFLFDNDKGTDCYARTSSLCNDPSAPLPHAAAGWRNTAMRRCRWSRCVMFRAVRRREQHACYLWSLLRPQLGGATLRSPSTTPRRPGGQCLSTRWQFATQVR